MLSLKSLPLALMLVLCACAARQVPSATDTPGVDEPVRPSSNQARPARSPVPATADAAPQSDATGAASETTIASATEPVVAASLPRGTTVLHIGDSFAGALGLDLNRELKAGGVRGILKYQTSSYIPNWASGKEIELYLANYNPDLVLVTLGANELEIPDPQERVRTIRKLVSRIAERPCVWIGPPLWEGARPALLEVIRKECAPCVYLDSTAHLPALARARDGIHPSGPARTEWAAFVVRWLAEHRDPSGDRPWSLRVAP